MKEIFLKGFYNVLSTTIGQGSYYWETKLAAGMCLRKDSAAMWTGCQPQLCHLLDV